jgi:hypothetical protein
MEMQTKKTDSWKSKNKNRKIEDYTKNQREK